MPYKDGSKTSVTEFFGDGEHVFDLIDKDWSLIGDLEAKIGNVLGALQRIRSSDWRVMELRHVIRTGLVGGGKSPQEAERMMATWFDRQPLSENIHLAIAIAGSAIFGSAPDEPAPPSPTEEAIARLEAEAADDPA